MSKQIVVKIKGGKVNIETRGFEGAACLEATRRLAKALGQTVSDTPTDDMYKMSVKTDAEIGQ